MRKKSTAVLAVLLSVLVIGASATALAAQPVLSRGDRGPAVERWQKDLNRWLAVERPEDAQLIVDGIFGRRTEAATRRFQDAMRITVDGIVGPETRAAMRGYLAGRGGQGVDDDGDRGGGEDGVLERGDSGPAVAEWQHDLNRWLAIERPKKRQLVVDGVFGRRTEKKTRVFQKAMNITVDGIVGPETRAAMDNYFDN